ncbi:MAG: crAss001_48 related protein [Comamonas testosteroni]|uniref:crAss001_48 related protein n=1 Tax=Comamonas testosteroni TaxID=285 RepID=UPI003D104CE1
MWLRPYHQQRVLDEKQELDISIARLDEFIQRNALFRQPGSDEQSRMRRQLDVMREYAVILGEHISAFQACWPAAGNELAASSIAFDHRHFRPIDRNHHTPHC